MNINIAEAQTEEILESNKCGRKKMWLMIRNHSQKQKLKVQGSIYLRILKLSIKLFEVSLVLLLNKIKGQV